MMTTDAPELTSFFDEQEVTLAVYNRYADAVHASHRDREQMMLLLADQREKLNAGQGDTLKIALGLLMVCRFGDALETFEKAPDSQMRFYFGGEAALGLGRFEEARTLFGRAAAAGWDRFETEMRVAAIRLREGDVDGAEKMLNKYAGSDDRAEWHYLKGLIADQRDDRVAAGEAYKRALEISPDHTQALFRSARLHDLCADDDEAIRMYERLSRQPRAHVNALINAAVIFEDNGKYDDAARCLRRVLKAYPNHQRARLFLKSVESCREMVVEEAAEAPIDARTRLLATALSEFELSVRARNCLKKMNIRTIGELMQLTEAELLAYKNFGETSLNEIKALLSKKGLRLGLQPEEVEVEAAEEVAPKVALPPGQEAVLSKPVSDLELSVRSRRCLQRLNVRTLGDLVQLSEAELLAARNFGVTSLNEIKARLADQGLQLASRAVGAGGGSV